MNRRDRRAAAKKPQSVPSHNIPPAPDYAGQAEARPGLLLRLFARLLLSGWVLKRVHQPEAVQMLLRVAQQAGRRDVVALLASRLNPSPRP